MKLLLAGDAGSALIVATLTGTPHSAIAIEGEPFEPPDGVERVELVGGERETRENVVRWSVAHGIPVIERAIEPMEAPDWVRVVSVEAVTTGSGKTALTTKLARSLLRSGVNVAVVRHPIASARDAPAAHTLTSAADLSDKPLDVREELEPILSSRVPVIAGTDPHAMLALAAEPVKVIVWDGGGTAEPWIRADIRVIAIDLLRPLADDDAGRVANADVIVLTKADSAREEQARETELRVRAWNRDARLFLADMPVAVPESSRLVDRHVVVVEDAPSLLLGGLKAGAGAVAARRFRCRVVDPRPYAVGAIADALDAHPHIGAVVPSIGRTPGERDDLRASIAATPGDIVLWASAASPDGIVDRPVVRAYPELIESAGGSLQDVIRPLLPGESLRIRRRPTP